MFVHGCRLTGKMTGACNLGTTTWALPLCYHTYLVKCDNTTRFVSICLVVCKAVQHYIIIALSTVQCGCKSGAVYVFHSRVAAAQSIFRWERSCWTTIPSSTSCRGLNPCARSTEPCRATRLARHTDRMNKQAGRRVQTPNTPEHVVHVFGSNQLIEAAG